MELGDRFKTSDDVVGRMVGGELVLLDMASGTYFGLDPVGSLIWEMLSAGPVTLGEASDAVEREYDAPRDRIEADVIALAADLSEKGLIIAAPL